MSESSQSLTHNQNRDETFFTRPTLVILLQLSALLVTLLIFINAGVEFLSVTRDFGHFSLKWRFAFGSYILIASITFLALFVRVWWPARTSPFVQRFAIWREHMGWLLWLAVVIILIMPIWFLQYTHWGNVFSGPYIRLLLFLGSAGLVGVLVTREEKSGENTCFLSYSGLLTGLLLSGAVFVLANGILGVSNYPLSIGWSEGNRMWDYSILFGRYRYIYPADKSIQPYLDVGRQLLWGIPFIFPNLTVFQFRLYNALISTLPYAIFGWLVFKRKPANVWLWALAGLWSLIFLRQGPIYTPLVICAMLVAISWHRSVWLAFPLVVVAGYYASLTRVNWIFTPAIWIGMMVFAEVPFRVGRNDFRTEKWPWGRTILLGLAGLIGGFFIPKQAMLFDLMVATVKKASLMADLLLFSGVIFLIILYGLWRHYRHLSLWRFVGITLVIIGVLVVLGVLVVFFRGYIAAGITDQQLLWERLLPTPTNPLGIISTLLIAVMPLVCLLLYWLWKRDWRLDWLRMAAILGPFLAFLGVGLVVSVKIGGGNNLHNLDMFLVGLVFIAALAWQAGCDQWIIQLGKRPFNNSTSLPRLILLLVVMVPAIQQVLYLRPLDLPEAEKVDNALTRVVAEVAKAKEQGEVLFLDQRQLLTFGNIKDVTLVPEYEKKYLMDRALSNNAAYFEQFYKDLANHRFVLIVSEPLKVRYNFEKDSDYGFGEENDLWVKWVAEPILRYYQPLDTFKSRRIQLLVPIPDSKKSP